MIAGEAAMGEPEIQQPLESVPPATTNRVLTAPGTLERHPGTFETSSSHKSSVVMMLAQLAR